MYSLRARCSPGGVSSCVRCGPGGAPARAAAFPAAPAQVSSAQPKPGGHYPLPLSPSELRAPLAHADGARLHRRRPPALGRFALVPLEAIDLLEVLAAAVERPVRVPRDRRRSPSRPARRARSTRRAWPRSRAWVARIRPAAPQTRSAAPQTRSAAAQSRGCAPHLLGDPLTLALKLPARPGEGAKGSAVGSSVMAARLLSSVENSCPTPASRGTAFGTANRGTTPGFLRISTRFVGRFSHRDGGCRRRIRSRPPCFRLPPASWSSTA